MVEPIMMLIVEDAVFWYAGGSLLRGGGFTTSTLMVSSTKWLTETSRCIFRHLKTSSVGLLQMSSGNFHSVQYVRLSHQSCLTIGVTQPCTGSSAGLLLLFFIYLFIFSLPGSGNLIKRTTGPNTEYSANVEDVEKSVSANLLGFFIG